MKIEKRQQIVETTVYIAEDGTEFADKDRCERYEAQDLFEWAKAKLMTLPTFCGEPPACDYYADYSWVRLESREDLVALRVGEFQQDSIAYEYEPPSYPCWVLYHVDDQGDGYISGTLEELENDFRAFASTVRQKIKEQEEKAEWRYGC